MMNPYIRKMRCSKKMLIIVMTLLCLSVGTWVSAAAVSLKVDGAPASVSYSLQNGTTYVPLRAMTSILSPGASVAWEGGRAVVTKQDLTLTARPGDCYVEANNRMLYAAGGVLADNGVTMVPLRVLCKAFGASVTWDAATGTAAVVSGSGTIASGDSWYDSDSVTWLSRIIQAESAGEPLKGKIAVGNVILNRTRTPGFPDTIYGVIFDHRWGGQFQPVKNGTIYNTPAPESVLAAKLCLDGASVAGNSVYFLNPSISSNFWTMENRDYVATIGGHQFYA
jgi:N-acetylmuramoyl-L-alanine amidase